MISDTLQMSKDLQPVFTAEQAETLTNALNKNGSANVATKSDIKDLKVEIAELRSEMTIEFTKVRSEFRSEFTVIRSELKESLASFKIDMVKWIVGAIAFNLLGTGGFIIALVKYLGH